MATSARVNQDLPQFLGHTTAIPPARIKVRWKILDPAVCREAYYRVEDLGERINLSVRLRYKGVDYDRVAQPLVGVGWNRSHGLTVVTPQGAQAQV